MQFAIEEEVHKIIILGDLGVGKTSILLTYVDEYNNEKYVSIGFDFKTKELEIEDKLVRQQLWDTSGQERFRALAKSHYKSLSGVVLVFDITNEKSFESIEKWRSDALENANNENLQFILIGNKKDLERNRKITVEQGKELAKKLNMSYFETTIEDNDSIQTALSGISKDICSANQKARMMKSGMKNNQAEKEPELSKSMTKSQKKNATQNVEAENENNNQMNISLTKKPRNTAAQQQQVEKKNCC